MTSQDRPRGVRIQRSAFCEEWHAPGDTGGTGILLFRIYPGILLKVNNMRLSAVDMPPTADYHCLKINCCVSGRCEVPIAGGQYVYLESGRIDLDLRQPDHECLFPGGLYQGLEIVADLPVIGQSCPPVFRELGIDIAAAARRLRAENGTRILTADSCLMQLLTDIYTHLLSEHGTTSLPVCRFYAAELLQRIFALPADDRTRYVSAAQRSVAVAAERYLLEHESAPVSVAELASRLHVSPTTLENYFQAVYGMTIHAYVHHRRIALARSLLEQSDLPVAEIARRAGYTHPGKFSAAFKKHTGMSPLEYRRTHAGVSVQAMFTLPRR